MLIDLALLAGIEASHNLGEQSISGLAEAHLRAGAVSTRVLANTSDKIESGAGYILGTDIDLAAGPLALGAGYRYRDGGYWVKQSYWARGGVVIDPASLMLSVDVTTANRVRKLELTTRADLGPIVVEYQVGPVSYVQANQRRWGFRAAVLLGLGR